MTNAAFDILATAARSIGYRNEGLRRNYAYADVLGNDPSLLRHADFVAFTQSPPSYRSAAFAAVESEERDLNDVASEHRSLGAPILLVIDKDQVSVWQIRHATRPVFVEAVPVKDLPNLFAKHADHWSPQALHRAKSIGARGADVQLDFVDIGLLPAIESEVRTKLDQMLRDVLLVAKVGSGAEAFKGRRLLRGCFLLLAAKILIDRGHAHAAGWDNLSVDDVLQKISDYYHLSSGSLASSAERSGLEAAWDTLKSAINIANVSADDLAFVYENTLVTPEIRSELGTHSTPAGVANYVLERLEIWRWDHPPKVFEPFTGAGVFLVAAHRHLKENLDPSLTDEEQHRVLVDSISGAEFDEFAREVAKLSLVLADYPNANGWLIESADLFSPGELEKRVREADIVLCNPPYEDFSNAERAKYRPFDVKKGRFVLQTVLDNPPAAIGFVLPRTLAVGSAYRRQRAQLAEMYDHIELVELPDGIFHVSQLETVLLIAREPTTAASTALQLVSSEVHRKDIGSFEQFGNVSSSRSRSVPRPVQEADRLWIPALAELWDELGKAPKLSSVVEIHRGIEWVSGLQASAYSDTSAPGFRRGVHSAKRHHQYSLPRLVFLNTKTSDLRGGAIDLPWDRAKILTNSVRLSRGPWQFAAAVDDSGLVASQQYMAMWANDPNMDLDALSAVLNGYVANAYLFTNTLNKGYAIARLGQLPIPAVIPSELGGLVRQYRAKLEQWQPLSSDQNPHGLLRDIDEIVLAAYDLPVALETELRALFAGIVRPLGHGQTPEASISRSGQTLAANARARARFVRQNEVIFASDWHDSSPALSVDSAGMKLLPLFQFTDAAATAAVRAAIESLPSAMSHWQIALWFDAPNASLDGRRPADCLSLPGRVVAAARREAEPIVG